MNDALGQAVGLCLAQRGGSGADQGVQQASILIRHWRGWRPARRHSVKMTSGAFRLSAQPGFVSGIGGDGESRPARRQVQFGDGAAERLGLRESRRQRMPARQPRGQQHCFAVQAFLNAAGGIAHNGRHRQPGCVAEIQQRRKNGAGVGSLLQHRQHPFPNSAVQARAQEIIAVLDAMRRRPMADQLADFIAPQQALEVRFAQARSQVHASAPRSPPMPAAKAPLPIQAFGSVTPRWPWYLPPRSL